jgi:hypothetical protein
MYVVLSAGNVVPEALANIYHRRDVAAISLRRYYQSHLCIHAHFPSKAIRPAPRHITPKAASTTRNLAFLMTLLNMNS